MFGPGDIITGAKNFNEGMLVEIVEIRTTGYTWKTLCYDELYESDFTDDPYFEDWKLKQ
ncbi:hypothetical protein NLX67_15945 [Domibacillus sp. A3M-37]|uniref:hypothetical protein n=1 Tax=Domibacillus sp. A3M-37 TaxID=2962037 RepID=UPI0020B81905|nr:hypothetical protein [Domibacillus sp. A3M-37]MCP3763864.1 hypothetical protein [Domibacillus sp. A3M-37]